MERIALEEALDYQVYQQEYAEKKTLRWKPRPAATKPGKISHHGPPIDFSFLKLQDVQSLRKERPRAGKRRPIEKDEDEEDTKKGDQPVVNGDEKEGEKAKEGEKVTQVIKNTAVP
jgi:hypothetical protein